MRTIRHRLVYAAAIATGVVWFGTCLQYDSLQRERHRFAEVRRDLREARALGALSMVLARERGRTRSVTVGIASSGSAADEVRDARRRVDAELALARSQPPQGPALRAQIDTARAMVDRGGEDLESSFVAYTAIITALNVRASRRLAAGMLALGLPFEHLSATRDVVEHARRCRGLVLRALTARALAPETWQLIRSEHLLAEDARDRAVIASPPDAHGAAVSLGTGEPHWRAWAAEWRALEADPQAYVQRASRDVWWRVASASVDVLERTLDAEINAAVRTAEGQIAAIQRRVYGAVAAMTLLGLISLALLLSAVVRVVRGLGGLVNGISNVVDRRDLAARVPVEAADEFGEIGTSVNLLVGTLAGLMAERDAQAETDALTHVMNRKGLDRILAERTASTHGAPEPFGLLVLDIDHFKKINDEFGHLRGDAVLAGVAGVARRVLRAHDVLGRWGGEEFVVVLSGGAEVDLHASAEKLRAAIASADVGLGRPVTVSIGACMWRPNVSLHEAFEAADGALYRAKSQGRNRCVVLSRVLPRRRSRLSFVPA
ncbi:MAG: diguanylate cyclase [Polyangiales bacterium]